MIAYDKTLLNNVYLDEEANRLKQSGFISVEQYNTFKTQFPRLKSQNNIFLRILFFILGCMTYSSVCGMLSFAGIIILNNRFLFITYLFAIIGFGAKEVMSKKMNFFGYGLDDAFILGGILALLIAVNTTFEKSLSPNHLLTIILLAIASSVAYLRYLNLFLALLACFGITASLAYITFEYCVIGKSILPFAMLLFSAICYFISGKKLEKLTVPYYYNGLKLAKNFYLILFYLAGNYYVVRELNFYLSENHSNIKISPEIPFSLFFWIFTISIPIVYLFFALKKRDRIMLWIGFLALCFAFFTIRMYHHVLPLEVALTIGGVLVFAFTYFSIKKLKHKESGITFKDDRFIDPNAFANLQVLVSTSQFGIKPEMKIEESPIEFGDGKFSGGGSSGEF